MNLAPQAGLEPRGHRLLDAAWIPLTLVYLALVVPLGRPLFLDVDEGYNVMRASLFLDGFQLYSQVWYDQPPLLSILLAVLFKIFGQVLLPARLAMAGFALVFVGSFYTLARNLSGNRLQALLAAAFLLSSAYFVRIAVSIMESMPSLSLAMLCMALVSGRNSGPGRAMSAGAVFGTALQFKMNVFFFFPFVLWLMLGKPRPIQRIFAWLAGAAAATAVTVLLFYHPGWEKMFLIHRSARGIAELAVLSGSNILPIFARYDIALAALFACGAFFRPDGKRDRLLPFAWLCGILAILLFHRPVWYHYYLLVSPALCLLAADTVFRLLNSRELPATEGLRKGLRFMLGVFLVLLFMGHFARNYRHIRNLGFEVDPGIVKAMQEQAGSTRWVLAMDRQLYPFLCGLRTPPELAVTSWKRNFAGEMDRDTVTRIAQQYQPEQVILASNLTYQPEFLQWLESSYRLAAQSPNTKLYIATQLEAVHR